MFKIIFSNHYLNVLDDELLIDIQDKLQELVSEEDLANLKIIDLYEEIKGQEVYAVLDINDKVVVEMLQPFTVLLQSHSTVITQHIWDSYASKCSGLSLSEIAIKVWKPCFEEVQQLVEKLYSKSVTLQEINHYFRGIEPRNLEKQIFKLVEGCNICLNAPVSVTWVSEIVVSVNRYRNIYELEQVVELMLAAKKSLNLTSDFKELNKLKEKVRNVLYYIHA